MASLEADLHTKKHTVSAGRESVDVISVEGEHDLVTRHGVSCRDVQQEALGEGILPLRYLRNYGTIGLQGQSVLLCSTVAIVGVGGLGGLIAELLVRMGVGHLVLIDGDCFEDNNLNRQLFGTEDNLRKSKVECAGQRISRINCGTELTLYNLALSPDKGPDLLGPCHIAVDALDNVHSRFVLQKVAGSLGIPMVHGAIGGFLGQVTTIFPGDRGLYAFYQEGGSSPDTLAETEKGNPSATPAMTASWQAQETIKYLVGKGDLLHNRMLFLDALTVSVEVMEY